MRTRAQIYGELFDCLARFAKLTDSDRWNDVTAEQQCALQELYVAIVRARDVCRAVALAFSGSGPRTL